MAERVDARIAGVILVDPVDVQPVSVLVIEIQEPLPVSHGARMPNSCTEGLCRTLHGAARSTLIAMIRRRPATAPVPRPAGSAGNLATTRLPHTSPILPSDIPQVPAKTPFSASCSFFKGSGARMCPLLKGSNK